MPGMFDTVSLTRTWDHLFALGDPPDYEPDPDTSLAARAARMGIAPAELAYDLLASGDGRTILFHPGANYSDCSDANMAAMLRDPNTIIALGDGGAHVGIMLGNCPEFIEVYTACALAGLVAVCVPTRYRARELEYVIGNSEVEGLGASLTLESLTNFFEENPSVGNKIIDKDTDVGVASAEYEGFIPS